MLFSTQKNKIQKISTVLLLLRFLRMVLVSGKGAINSYFFLTKCQPHFNMHIESQIPSLFQRVMPHKKGGRPPYENNLHFTDFQKLVFLNVN